MQQEGQLSSQCAVRRVFMVLSPRALPYARLALQSLFANHIEPIHLHLITDTAADKQLLAEELSERQQAGPHRWDVHDQQELLDREASLFASHPQLRAFRGGHPCWRKITDPLLLSGPGQEMVLLDPDLYFPNRFRFELTPAEGVLLMWQRPNCLLPDAAVRAAMEAGVPLARHVDIGVAGWRGNADLDWLDWLLTRIDAQLWSAWMHIEAIVWAALAMRLGGGHLDPNYWVCWQRTQAKRLMRKLGMSGIGILRRERLAHAKCFHAGGEAKNYLAEAQGKGILAGRGTVQGACRILPYQELSPTVYRRERQMKTFIKIAGYYRIFES